LLDTIEMGGLCLTRHGLFRDRRVQPLKSFPV
jgi:hypothetical protein